MDAKLKVIGGKANKGSISLKLPTVIGRSRKAGLTIAHPMISRKHCKLFEADGLLMIHDLDSLNGTVIDEKRVKESPLPPNAEFSIGPLTFRAEYEYSGDLSAMPEVVLSDKPVPQPDQQESWSDTPEPISLDQMTETVSPSEQAAVELSFLNEIQDDQPEAVAEQAPEEPKAEPPAPPKKEEPVAAPPPPTEPSKPAASKKKPKGLGSMFKGASKKNGEKKANKPSAPPVDQPPTEKDPAAASVAKQPAKEDDFPLAPEAKDGSAPPKTPADKPADEEFDIDSFLDGLE